MNNKISVEGKGVEQGMFGSRITTGNALVKGPILQPLILGSIVDFSHLHFLVS